MFQAGGKSKIFPYVVIMTRIKLQVRGNPRCTIGEHVATCGFTLVPCPIECEDRNGVAENFLKERYSKASSAILP